MQVPVQSETGWIATRVFGIEMTGEVTHQLFHMVINGVERFRWIQVILTGQEEMTYKLPYHAFDAEDVNIASTLSRFIA